jgi:hypothetical protein
MRPADPHVSRPGIVWPIEVAYEYPNDAPAAFVELAFVPKGDHPEPLSHEAWEDCRRRFGLTSLRDNPHPSKSTSYIAEFGPSMVVRSADEPFSLVLPPPPSVWENAVRQSGSCLIGVGKGLGYLDNAAIAVPEDTSVFIATCGPSTPAPPLTEIPKLHVLPLTTVECDPLGPCTFLLDTDVLIAIERFCCSPHRLGAKLASIRDLMLNLACRDALPGLALAQMYQCGRTVTNVVQAEHAAMAFHEVMAWDRERIASHTTACASFRPGWLREFTGLTADPAMLALYAGVLHLRRVWDPAAPLLTRVSTFESFVQWLRNDLRLAAAPLFQIAANLLISGEAAHNQASRLLRFRSGAVTLNTSGELWGTAFDLYIIGGHAIGVTEQDVIEPVLLTFDAGLARMYDFFRHAGRGPIPADAEAEPLHGFYVATRVDLHPRLNHLQPRIEHWLEELQADMFARVAQGSFLAYRHEEMNAIAEREEQLLLAAQ